MSESFVFVSCAPAIGSLLAQQRPGISDRFNDLLVTGAPTKIAFDAAPDLVRRRVLGLPQHRPSLHDNAGRTETTLYRAAVDQAPFQPPGSSPPCHPLTA